MNVSMWEARAAAGRLDQLVDWAHTRALPAIAEAAGRQRAEVFSDGAERVVVITWWSGEPVALPDPPDALLARAPHAWRFVQIVR